VAERDVLESHAVIDVHGREEYSSANWIAALKRPTTVLIGLIYFLNQVAFVGLYFFAPAIVHQMHVDSPLLIGFLAASVGLGFLLGVLILPRIHRRVNSDCVFLGVLTAGLVVGACVYLAVTTPAARICLLTVTAFFGGGVLPSYWAIAMKRLQGIQAAAGLAFINTIGLIGGFVGPYLFGMAETSSGRSDAGFTVILVAAVLGLALVPLLAKAIRSEDHVESLREPAAQMKP
jgi:predicted MFS family arabinose efflux permease